MASKAEAELRAKAVARMRRLWPSARIIHELQLEKWGVRIDLAAVTPDFICVAEIKSELDTLKRLPRQLAVSTTRANEAWVVVAERHDAAAARLWEYPRDLTDETRLGATEAWRVVNRAKRLVDRGAAELFEATWRSRVSHPVVNAADMFGLLWSSEMRDAIGLHFGGAAVPLHGLGRMGQYKLTETAVEYMTGREVRRAVCRQLRSRPFPNADPPCEPRLATLGGAEEDDATG